MTIAVSSYSLHRVLGPLQYRVRTPAGVFKGELPFPRRHSLEEFATLTRDRLGVDAIELCQMQIGDASDERIDALRRSLDAAGVRVLTVPIDVGDLAVATAEERADDIRRIESWFAVAERLGATFVRVNTASPVPSGGEEDHEALVAALRSLATSAEARALRLLVENHGGSSSDPEFLLGLRAEVGPEHLGILLDLGNFEPVISVARARAAGAPIDETGLDVEPLFEHIARLAPFATLVHGKAFDPLASGEPLLDLDRALRIVARSGYAGPISVEWEGVLGDPWDGTRATLEVVRAVFPDLAAPSPTAANSPSTTTV